MLRTETPMNKPSSPPQLEMNSDIVLVSDRLIMMKLSFLNSNFNTFCVLNLYSKWTNDENINMESIDEIIESKLIFTIPILLISLLCFLIRFKMMALHKWTFIFVANRCTIGQTITLLQSWCDWILELYRSTALYLFKPTGFSVFVPCEIDLDILL